MKFGLSPIQKRYAFWMLLGSLACFSVAAAAADRFRIAYDGQATRCLPWSVYLIDLDVEGLLLQRGDLVAYGAKGVKGFAEGTLFLKRVRAIAGDAIRIDGGDVSINDVVVDTLRDEVLSMLNRKADAFDQSYAVSEQAYFVMGEAATSYDSRYTGTIQHEQVVGKARGLW